jgi:hypothetical protein
MTTLSVTHAPWSTRSSVALRISATVAALAAAASAHNHRLIMLACIVVPTLAAMTAYAVKHRAETTWGSLVAVPAAIGGAITAAASWPASAGEQVLTVAIVTVAALAYAGAITIVMVLGKQPPVR